MKKINLKLDINKNEFKQKLDIKDGLDGKDGLNGLNGEPGKDGSPDAPIEIKNKIESLTGGDRLNIESLQGLDKVEANFLNQAKGFAPRALTSLYDVNANPSDAQVLTYNKATNKWIATTPTPAPSIGGTITGGTSGSVLFVNPTGIIAQDNANFSFTDDATLLFQIGSVSTAGQAITKIKGGVLSGSSTTDNFLNITGTLPTVITVAANAVNWNITSAGSSAVQQRVALMQLNAGYTGSGATAVIRATNAAAGTGIGGWTFGAANAGIDFLTSGATATGHNIGVRGQASGSSILNIAGLNGATQVTGSPALNIGTGSLALNATTNVAGFFGLMNTAPTLGTSAALIADNGATGSNIFDARINGTSAFTIGGAGYIRQLGRNTYPLTRTLPTTVNDAVNIGTFTSTSGAAGAVFYVSVAINLGGFAQSQLYYISTKYDITNSIWNEILPISDTGPYFGNSAVIDANVSAGTIQFRLRRKASNVAGGTVNIMLVQEGDITDTFVPSTSVSSVSAPTILYPLNQINQANGNVGISTFNAPVGQLQVYDLPSVDISTYSLNNWNGTGFKVPGYFGITTNNGGNTPATALPALVLGRAGVSGESYSNFAEFLLSHYAVSGTKSKTQLDIALRKGDAANAGTKIMSLRDDGTVGIGTTAPTALLHLGAGTATANTAPLKFSLPGVPLTTPEAGVLETDANNIFYTATSLARKALDGTLFTQTADKTVANTVTETSIVGTGNGYGLTLPANFFVVGKTIKVRVSGYYSTVAITGDTVTIKVKYGSTVLATKATTALVTGGTNLSWWADLVITCRSVGATGTVQLDGGVTYQIAGSAAIIDEINNGRTTSTLDTTASALFDVTVTHSAANVSNTITSLVSSWQVNN